MPTSVLLAVLAAAGLLALAPALVRRYDAAERLEAERARSTARVLSRTRRKRTVPGRRPINPPLQSLRSGGAQRSLVTPDTADAAEAPASGEPQPLTSEPLGEAAVPEPVPSRGRRTRAPSLPIPVAAVGSRGGVVGGNAGPGSEPAGSAAAGAALPGPGWSPSLPALRHRPDAAPVPLRRSTGAAGC